MISPHRKCLTSFITEVYNRLNGLAPDIMDNLLTVLKKWYSTRHYNLFMIDRPKTDKYGQNLIPNRADQS